MTKVIAERGQHFAEVAVFLVSGGLGAKLRGPGRRDRREALKDCLELRKVAVKCTGDPTLFKLRQRKKELDSTTWTVKDLGGRLLDGAEGPPPGYATPRATHEDDTGVATGACRDAELHRSSKAAAREPASTSSKSKGLARGGAAARMGAVIEVADVEIAMGDARIAGDWTSRAKVALQKLFKRFGAVVEVRVSDGDHGDVAASVRFASASAADRAMCGAPQGYLCLDGGGEIRMRHPGSKEDVWRRFPPPRCRPAPDAQPRKKKLRPNERYAACFPGEREPEQDESERFWDAQQENRGAAAEPPPPAAQGEEPPAKPVPCRPLPGATAEDLDVCRGQEAVAKEMGAIPELPFSQQKRAVKALRLRWHPDKNPEMALVATRVFHFIQEHDQWLAHIGLG